ncbi:hypothetical protein G6F31_019199 [Rhizopus arrhizus]|nr:hypothetical protein G6F31_019199 [Rhizopus arrhizus]
MVTGVYSNLPSDAAIPALTCPAGLTPWRHAAVQSLDVTVTGGDVNVAGAVGGTIQGSGSVNAAGTVSVNGSFSGSFQNSGSSYVKVAQAVTISADRILITPGSANARAAVIQGCKT